MDKKTDTKKPWSYWARVTKDATSSKKAVEETPSEKALKEVFKGTSNKKIAEEMSGKKAVEENPSEKALKEVFKGTSSKKIAEEMSGKKAVKEKSSEKVIKEKAVEETPSEKALKEAFKGTSSKKIAEEMSSKKAVEETPSEKALKEVFKGTSSKKIAKEMSGKKAVEENSNEEVIKDKAAVHEFVFMSLLKEAGVPVPKFGVTKTAAEAKQIAVDTGTNDLVVKAQVLAGGAKGGVRLVYSPEEVEEASAGMTRDFLITKQTGAEGRICNTVMVTGRKYTRKESYIAFMNERSFNGLVCIASSEGGVSIEEVAEKNPDAIVRYLINVISDLDVAGAKEIATMIGIH